MFEQRTPSTSQIGYEYNSLYDLAVVIFVLVLVKQVALPFSFLYAGPISTFCTMLVAHHLLYGRNFRWRDLGFKMPENWVVTIGWTALTLLVIVLAASFASVVTGYDSGSIGDKDRFQHIEGNLFAYIVIMLIVWTHGSFFEELLFRAFIITTLSKFLGETLRSDILAVIISSAFFGYRHYYYQGASGAIQAGTIGLALGFLYIWFGRKNILPLIFAHGIVNSISQTQIFLGDSTSFFDD